MYFVFFIFANLEFFLNQLTSVLNKLETLSTGFMLGELSDHKSKK